MKSQNTLIIVAIFGIIIAFMFSYIYLNSFNPTYFKSSHIVNVESRIKLSVANLENIHEKLTGMSYLELLSYVTDSGSTKFCVNSTGCINISKIITSYFNTYFGHNWNLTIYVKPPALKGWIIKMFVVTGNRGDYNVCAYNPPKDAKGHEWWEYDYNDSFFINNWNTTVDGRSVKGAGWVLVSAPFHEQNSCERWGLSSLYNGYCTNTAINNGVCIPIWKLLPEYKEYYISHVGKVLNASVFCPNGEWDLYRSFMNWDACAGNNNIKSVSYNYLKTISIAKEPPPCIYYSNPPIYKTATDITLLAKELGIISSLYNPITGYSPVVGSFYRGKVRIPSFCSKVYIDIGWHEVARLYISYINKSGNYTYVWILASPVCNGYSEDPNGKKGPIEEWTIHNAEDIINITRWVIDDRNPKNNTIIIANAYWDPHNNSNGVSMVRVYCFDKNGKKYELNDNFYLESSGTNKKKVYMGYIPPKSGNIYTFKIWLPIEGSTIPVWYAVLKVW